MIYELFIQPFAEYSFMRRALLACVLICCAAIPVGLFMILRRMSLTGDALSHAVLPGVAVAYFFAGMSLAWMTLGGIVAGVIVAFTASFISRHTQHNEDESLAVLYLVSLALGVLVIASSGGNIDLLTVLFGSVLSLDLAGLMVLAVITVSSAIIFVFIYPALILECFDPHFFRQVSRNGYWVHYCYLLLMVINLVAGFHALGTLMSVGLMIIPAAIARYWRSSIAGMIIVAVLTGIFSCYLGLLVSFNFDSPSGPAILLILGGFFVVSLFFGSRNGLLRRKPQSTHLTS